MIISASRRTDIPAFYGEWFIKRIQEGYFYRINPFNKNQVKGISLAPEDVDAFVFWTKNPEPFMKYLDILDEKGYSYYFQYTMNSYDKVFEPNTPPIEKRIESFIAISKRLGSERINWRYDPIIFSSVTDKDYHLKNIENISKSLYGYTNRLTISFLDIYDKVKNRISEIERKHNIKVYDINNGISKVEIYDFSRSVYEITSKYGIEVFTCAEEIDLSECGIKKGCCVDGNLIKRLFSIEKDFKRDKNQRPECLCVESVDMGVYNTCRFGCAYCYANYSDSILRGNLENHIKESPALIGDYEKDIEILKDEKQKEEEKQISMFTK